MIDAVHFITIRLNVVSSSTSTDYHQKSRNIPFTIIAVFGQKSFMSCTICAAAIHRPRRTDRTLRQGSRKQGECSAQLKSCFSSSLSTREASFFLCQASRPRVLAYVRIARASSDDANALLAICALLPYRSFL